MKDKDIISVLVENKFKITKFRKILVDIFVENCHTLLSAKMLKQVLLDEYDYNASFDTIYKNLNVFCNLSIIHERVINHESFYILSETLEEHHHFICLRCNVVIDIKDYCLIDDLQQKYDGFEVTGHNLELFGTCKNCKLEE